MKLIIGIAVVAALAAACGAKEYAVGTATVTGSTNTAGQLRWVKSLQGSATSMGVAADSSGNVVSVGYFNPTVDFGSGKVLTSAGAADAFLAQYSPDGRSCQWARQIGGALGPSPPPISIPCSRSIRVCTCLPSTPSGTRTAVSGASR